MVTITAGRSSLKNIRKNTWPGRYVIPDRCFYLYQEKQESRPDRAALLRGEKAKMENGFTKE